MDQEPILAEEFKQRLAQLCLRGNSPELPRKPRDRQIVLKSIAFYLSPDRTYTEPELKSIFTDWTNSVGQSMPVDHATLRRTLIDEKYLERTAGGQSYQLRSKPSAIPFAPEVAGIDPAQVIEDAQAEARAKRMQYQKREGK